MTAYGYNGETMEYTGPVNCQLDPVRSRKERREIFLLPGNSTYTPPPDFDPETQKAKWTGEAWDVEEIPPEPEPSPDQQPAYTDTQLLGQQMTDLELLVMEHITNQPEN